MLLIKRTVNIVAHSHTRAYSRTPATNGHKWLSENTGSNCYKKKKKTNMDETRTRESGWLNVSGSIAKCSANAVRGERKIALAYWVYLNLADLSSKGMRVFSMQNRKSCARVVQKHIVTCTTIWRLATLKAKRTHTHTHTQTQTTFIFFGSLFHPLQIIKCERVSVCMCCRC